MRTKTLSIPNENDTVNEWAMVHDGEWRYISIDLLLLSRVSHISSRNLKHSDHRAVIVLFYGFVFCCAVVGVFSHLNWKNGNALRATQSPATNAVYMRVTLIIIKCFVFFRPFQLCSNTWKKGVKNWRGDDKYNACKNLLSTTLNVFRWVYVCTKVQVHALADCVAWLQTTYFCLTATYTHR